MVASAGDLPGRHGTGRQPGHGQVYVVRGQVGFGAGDGVTPESARSTTTGRWETSAALITVLRRTRSSFTRPHPAAPTLYVDNVGLHASPNLACYGSLRPVDRPAHPPGPHRVATRRRAGCYLVDPFWRSGNWLRALSSYLAPNGGNKTLHVVTDRRAVAWCRSRGPAPAR